MARWKANLLMLAIVWAAHFVAGLPEITRLARNWSIVSGTAFEVRWLGSVAR